MLPRYSQEPKQEAPVSPTSTCDTLTVTDGLPLDSMMLDSLSERGTPRDEDVSESDLFNDLLDMDSSTTTPTSPRLGLIDIHDDVVCKILSFLPASSIISSSQTCRYLRACGNRDELWYWVYHYRWPPRKDRYGRRANLRYKPFVRCWKKELQLRADSEASGVDKAEVVDKSWGDWNAAVALGIQATPRGGHLTTTNEPSAPSSLRSPYSASRAAQLDRERRVWREARDEWMLWRVVYRDTEEHPDPKDFPTHTCDNTRCTLWRSRKFRDAFVCDETGHIHECNGRTMEDSACDSAMWDRGNQCWVCPISMRIFRYAAPRNAAVEQGIEPGGEDFGPAQYLGDDSRGIVDPRAGEGECGEVEGQGGDGGVAVGNKNCFLDWYYQGYEASMADERREAEAERRNFERMGEARFRGASLHGHRCHRSNEARRKRSHPQAVADGGPERPCALRRLL